MLNMKSLLFKPQQEETPAPAAANTSLLTERLKALRTPLENSPAVAPAQVDAEFTADLLAALDKSTLPGFKEFNQQMELLAGAIPDENMRLQTALASTAKFLKITRDQLLAAVEEQIRLITSARDEFDRGLRAEVDSRTSSCTNHLTDVNAKIMASEAELARLFADRDDTQRQLTLIKSEEQAVTARFRSAYQPLYDSLTNTLTRLRARVG